MRPIELDRKGMKGFEGDAVNRDGTLDVLRAWFFGFPEFPTIWSVVISTRVSQISWFTVKRRTLDTFKMVASVGLGLIEVLQYVLAAAFCHRRRIQLAPPAQLSFPYHTVHASNGFIHITLPSHLDGEYTISMPPAANQHLFQDGHIWSRPPAGYPPPRYGPGRSIGPGTWHAFAAPSLGYLPPFLPLFSHLIDFLANTTGFYTICKHYDSINQHSHPSTSTPPAPTGGEAGNHDHPWGGEGPERRWSIYANTESGGTHYSPSATCCPKAAARAATLSAMAWS